MRRPPLVSGPAGRGPRLDRSAGAPPATAGAVVERLAATARRVVFLSSRHQTPRPFFQQPNPLAVLHADLERRLAVTGLESTIIRPGMLASKTLFWWAPAVRAGGAVRWPSGAAETARVDDRDRGPLGRPDAAQLAGTPNARRTPGVRQ
jgi:hypothetical protein